MSKEKHVKVVVVGDGACNKTEILHVYKEKKFPEEYVPTVFDNYSCKVLADGKEVILTLWDTAGQEDFERLRPLAYNNTDVFVCCFSLVNHNSFINVKEKWIPEVKQFCPNAKLILVGTKLHLKRDENFVRQMMRKGERPVTKDEAEQMRKSNDCYKYIECSAKKNMFVKKVFDECVRVSLSNKSSSRGVVGILRDACSDVSQLAFEQMERFLDVLKNV